LDDRFTLRISYLANSDRIIASFTLSWKEIFSIIGSSFLTPFVDKLIEDSVVKFITLERGLRGPYKRLLDSDFDTIKLQFIAHSYLRNVVGATMPNGAVVELLELTEAGKKALIEIKAVYAPAKAVTLRAILYQRFAISRCEGWSSAG